MRDLMQEDWRDLIASFYFPKQSLVITDQRISLFLEQVDIQLNAAYQKLKVISNVLTKAILFIETNQDILENLISDLAAEQMFDAVAAIANHHLQIGTDKKNERMIAFASLTLGELITKQSLCDDASQAKAMLERAYQGY